MRIRAPEAGARTRNVVLFSGGRGSGALTGQLLANPNLHLTLVINGYDDGASTGEVRRFLGDSLGPSDFRKNASRVAAQLGTCPPDLIALLDSRLARGASREELVGAAHLARESWPAVSERLERFLQELNATGRGFEFDDCSIGNLAFAGSFLCSGRSFNRALDDYCALLGLPPGLIDNVTDGTNAWLVGVDGTGRVLPTEAAIVQHSRPGAVREIFLLSRPLANADLEACDGAGCAAEQWLARHSTVPQLNPRLIPVLAAADLIIYAAGTQHSSLFPSYLTSGLSAALSANLRAVKLLLTNIQPDAEIRGTSAVDIIERAVYYFTEKGRLSTPTPCLITHYLLNDPGHHEPERAYVPLGRLDAIEDPRLVRIGNYEDGVSGRHDAARVLTPFLEMLGHQDPPRAAVLLHDAGSSNKVAQTMIEFVRGGIEQLPLLVTVFYAAAAALDGAFTQALPFPVQWLPGGEGEFAAALRASRFDYAVLFESAGMYRGEDMVALAANLTGGRIDAVWGSRRLSIRDIEASYRLRYRRSPLAGLVSFAGSHLLSVAYLLLFGRYVSDTLSGVRAVRASDVVDLRVSPADRNVNHELLAALLKRKAGLLEVPVQFLPLSPDRVQRTSARDGLRALATILRRRFGW